MEKLIFNQTPTVYLCSNVFINVPIILQYEKTPLIQVVSSEKAGYTIEIPIYNNDGVYLAKVVGARLFLTENGKKSGLKLLHPQNATVCELNGKPLFELRREGAAGLRPAAELYTNDGTFIKCSDKLSPIMTSSLSDLTWPRSG